MNIHAISSSVAGISSSVVGAIKDAGNPFLRLVNSVTGDSSTVSVPYFQGEQVKEAAFQSATACETIHKGLHVRLDSTDDLVIRKTLDLCRLLLLEGPSPQFQQLMFSQSSGKVLAIANMKKTNPDLFVPKDSVLEGNINLAAALHKGITGDKGALAGFGLGQQARSAVGGQPASSSSSAAQQSYKSDFQSLQEREQKNFKKRREEERARRTGVVTNERQFEQFDASLAPQKLVDYAINHPKKKFADEELENFVEAAEEGGRTEEVCAALDKVLRDGKSSIQNRYKVLTIVDAMIRNLSPALAFFQQNNVGIYRHVALEAGDNPTKSAMMQQLSSAMMDIVYGKVRVPASPPIVVAPTPAAAAAPATFVAPAAPAAGLTPEQQQMAEMMEKMRAMQAQIAAAQQQQPAVSAPPAAAPAAAPTADAWGNSAATGGWGAAAAAPADTWGSPTANGASDWGSTKTPHNSFAMPPPAAAPVVAAAAPPKRDLLDDLFDASVPAPTGPSTFGLGGAKATTTEAEDGPTCPDNSVNTANSHAFFAQQLLQHQRSSDYVAEMAEAAEDGVGIGTSDNNHYAAQIAAVTGGAGAEPTLASEAVKMMLAAQQQNQNQATAAAANNDIAEKLRQMALLQQQFSLGGNNNNGAAVAPPAAAVALAEATPNDVTPITSFVTTPTVAEAPAGLGVVSASGTGAPAVAPAADDPLAQMRAMQEKMAMMMAQMQQQQAAATGGVSANIGVCPSASVFSTTTAVADEEPFSPNTYYKDPYSQSNPPTGAAPAAAAAFPVAAAPAAAASSPPSRRPEVLRLMARLEEQMGETRGILAEQQQQMGRLQAALAREV